MLLSTVNQADCMAVVPISYRDQRHFLQYLTRQRELGGRCIRTSEIFSKAYLRLALLENAPCRRKVQIVCRANGDSTNQVQLRVLDAYFRKFQDGARLSSGVVDRKMEFTEQTNELKSKQGLQSLDAYPGKDTKSEEAALPRFNQMSTLADGSAIPFSDEDNATRIGWQKPKLGVKGTDVEEKPGISQALSQIDEASDLYLIGIIASLNIAVFLFEIASPIRSPGMGPFSIPMLYGAKINGLILSGEWWRLVTPMFLHSGVLHMALGCWALLVFGPKVSRSYGPFTFLLIYFLGGISGNLISFLHTPELTVGGTGPIFAMIGAWLIYQIQNKGVIPKNVSHSLFQKAIITTALSFLLSNLGPIDDWSHFGAAATGIIYGYFTCPSLQMDNDLPSKGGQKEGITLIPRYADPCKSTLLFFLFILGLGCLAFLMESPLTNLMADDFV